jgi:hypothetical protein
LGFSTLTDSFLETGRGGGSCGRLAGAEADGMSVISISTGGRWKKNIREEHSNNF